MRRNNKKGFTIVELVIVIAVIAILAGVLIPTFAGIIKKANNSKALQEAQNAYKEAYAEAVADGKFDTNEKAVAGDYEFTFNGTLESFTCDVKVLDGSDAAKDKYAVTVDTKTGVVKVAEVEGEVTENATWKAE